MACTQTCKEAHIRKAQKMLPYLAPDGKTQVGIEYKNGRPYRIYSITVIASQNRPETSGGPELKKIKG